MDKSEDLMDEFVANAKKTQEEIENTDEKQRKSVLDRMRSYISPKSDEKKQTNSVEKHDNIFDYIEEELQKLRSELKDEISCVEDTLSTLSQNFIKSESCKCLSIPGTSKEIDFTETTKGNVEVHIPAQKLLIEESNMQNWLTKMKEQNVFVKSYEFAGDDEDATM